MSGDVYPPGEPFRDHEALNRLLDDRLRGIERALDRVASSIDAHRGVVDTAAPQEVAFTGKFVAATSEMAAALGATGNVAPDPRSFTREQMAEAMNLYRLALDGEQAVARNPITGFTGFVAPAPREGWIPAHESLPPVSTEGLSWTATVLVFHPELGVRLTHLLGGDKLWDWPADRTGGFRSVSTIGTFWRAIDTPPG